MAAAFHKLAPLPRDAPPDARFLTDRVRTARPADAPELAVNGHRSRPTPAPPPQPLGHRLVDNTGALQLAPPGAQLPPTRRKLDEKPRSRKKCCTSPFARCRPTGRCPPLRSAPGPPWVARAGEAGWPPPPWRCLDDTSPSH